VFGTFSAVYKFIITDWSIAS